MADDIYFNNDIEFNEINFTDDIKEDLVFTEEVPSKRTPCKWCSGKGFILKDNVKKFCTGCNGMGSNSNKKSENKPVYVPIDVYRVNRPELV
jgi:DnaJ-class molecular chaperone